MLFEMEDDGGQILILSDLISYIGLRLISLLSRIMSSAYKYCPTLLQPSRVSATSTESDSVSTF